MFHPDAARRCIFASVLGLFLLVVIPASGQSPAQSQWPTLAKVLEENSIPLPSRNTVDPAMRITSFGVINEPSQFAIAFYRDNGNNELKPPLYLLRYDKSAQRWIHNQLSGVQAMFTTGLMPAGKPLPADCLGSASIRSVPGFVLVNTHLTPSASCLMIFTPELKMLKALSGWLVTMVNSTLILQRSEIHVAPTHPLRLAAYDVKRDREFDLYPPPHDPFRAGFEKRLTVAADWDWCREHNAPCDPAQMSVNLGGLRVNAAASAFAIEIQYTSEAFGPEADADIGVETYFYVFKLAPKLDYRAFDEFDMKPKFGEATPDVLVRPDVLRRLFPANK